MSGPRYLCCALDEQGRPCPERALFVIVRPYPGQDSLHACARHLEALTQAQDRVEPLPELSEVRHASRPH